MEIGLDKRHKVDRYNDCIYCGQQQDRSKRESYCSKPRVRGAFLSLQELKLLSPYLMERTRNFYKETGSTDCQLYAEDGNFIALFRTVQ